MARPIKSAKSDFLVILIHLSSHHPNPIILLNNVVFTLHVKYVDIKVSSCTSFNIFNSNSLYLTTKYSTTKSNLLPLNFALGCKNKDDIY